MPLTRSQAQGLRLAGYFILFMAIISSVNWVRIIRRDYVMEHQWPTARGMVYSIREESRDVQPPSSRSHHYWVYWVEFLVVLDLPAEKCPGEMRLLDHQQPQCTGTVKTPEVRSRADAVEWIGRHPFNSNVMVHYDQQSGSTVFAGESIFQIYPWRQILLTAGLLLAGIVMVALGRATNSS